MSLHDALLNAPSKHTKIEGLLESLDLATRELLEDRLADPDITHAWLKRALKAAGHDIGLTTITTYRRALWGA